MARDITTSDFRKINARDMMPKTSDAYIHGVEYDPFGSSPPSSPNSFTVDSSPPSSPGVYALEHYFHGTFINDDDDDDEDGVDRYGHIGGDGLDGGNALGLHDMKGKEKENQHEVAPAAAAHAPAHPFSASTRAVKRPPRYDKDSSRVKVKRQRHGEPYFQDQTEPGHGSGNIQKSSDARLRVSFDLCFDPFPAAHREGIYERGAYLHDAYPSMDAEMEEDTDTGVSTDVLRSFDPEHALWEETIAQAVDGAECKIDLSGQGLTYIPPRIADLSNLVVFRDSAASSREDASRRTFSKTNSLVFGAGKLGMREDEIHLFLGNNKIAMLPNELFNLDALVTLSLRGNVLTELPPQIGQLRNLRELNVAYNRLRYLPSEIMNLKLTSLAVDPNPFMENPYPSKESSKHRWFGPTERRFTIPPFSELALRVLLAPAYKDNSLMRPTTAKTRQRTVLETLYDLPIPTDYDISPALREALSSCIPGSIASLMSAGATPYSSSQISQQQSNGSDCRACVSECPSLRHLIVSGEAEYRKPVFVAHAEERLSWEKEVAGQKVGGETGIPVRWRGCCAGCLDHLETAAPEDKGWERGDIKSSSGKGILHSDDPTSDAMCVIHNQDAHCDYEGVTHEGESTGKIETINGVRTYVAIPPADCDYPKEKALLFLPDVYGLELLNARLLTYIPDYLNNDPVPNDHLNGTFKIADWFPNHGADKTRPPLDEVIKGLNERGITTFGATGYCFGARYAFDLAFDKVIKVIAVSHPSLLQVPEDLINIKNTKVPVLINSCEFDSQYPPNWQTKGDEVLGGGNTEAEKYKRNYFAGCTHGFAVRGDLSNSVVREGKEGAFKASVEWFAKHL
ncbi:hypothetical protein EW145_g2824 [Phellinidium pouzarii]|uniref:Dienelactone hydrolase domain-containing protein n=1 Tax=Phellinidium pouzarii TaxID=167371 RepID=A0A4V6S186_9AGAM|nr:hypothetical protein EW145_g2824 [Phellinidium pouzarii]